MRANKEATLFFLPVPWWSLPLILLILLEGTSFAAEGFQVGGNTLHDYDTVTRLAYLRDVMARHAWNHGLFERINAPYGMRLHWTLPFNLILLGIVKAFALFNPATALQYAGYWTGPLFRVIIAPAAYWAGRQILSPVASAFASGMILFSPYLFDYAHRGTANHHVLLVLDSILLAGLALRTARRPEAGGLLPLALGAMAGFCLWTTFELVILVAPLFLILFVVWIVEGELRYRQVLLASAGFSLMLSVALLADAPHGRRRGRGVRPRFRPVPEPCGTADDHRHRSSVPAPRQRAPALPLLRGLRRRGIDGVAIELHDSHRRRPGRDGPVCRAGVAEPDPGSTADPLLARNRRPARAGVNHDCHDLQLE